VLGLWVLLPVFTEQHVGVALKLREKGEAAGAKRTGPVYRSPFAVVISPDGQTLFVSDRTAGCVVVMDVVTGEKVAEIPLRGEPTGLLLSPDGGTLYAAEFNARSVAVIDTARRKVIRRIQAGLRPVGLALAPRSGRLFTCNTDTNDVSVLDLAAGREIKGVPVVRQPMFAAITPDEKWLVVANALPLGSANNPDLGGVVSVVDTQTLEQVATIQLPSGSTNLRGICVSPDGHWAYVVHAVARFNIPPTQLERGWVNTHALSILDLTKRECYVTVLLDYLMEGGADPFGMAGSADGQTLWISLGGVHQIAIVPVGRLHTLLAGDIPAELTPDPPYDLGNQNIWRQIKEDQTARYQLVNDLTALYRADLLERVPSGGNGPRGICLSPDGTKLYVAHYFTGNVVEMDAAKGKVRRELSLGAQPELDPVRFGEQIFHDASLCFQHWQSCATCHPDTRSDGLRWDLLNDGMGNPKRTRSLVNSYRTAPVMAKGVRQEMGVAVRAGFKFILFAVRPEEEYEAVDSYLRAVQPRPSPFLTPDGKLTPAAKRGKQLFEGKADCVRCHPAPLYTDLQAYDVGTIGEFDQPDDRFYTPKLTELYRSSPYLHDGRAVTLQEVLTTYNPEDKHGRTSALSEEEINDLVAYLLSL